jgi:hypothetical protein
MTNASLNVDYRKSGYTQFARHRGYYEDGGDALRFEKSSPTCARSRWLGALWTARDPQR